MTMLRTLTFLLCSLAAQAALAATPPAPFCNNIPEYHQLDFWVGDWDTYETEAPKGDVIAHTQVSPIAQGCAVHELYEQADGLIGDSILSYDPVRKQWQQTWVTNRGSIMVLYGTFKDGTLTLQGDVHRNDGQTVQQRIYWKSQDGGVREWAEFSKDSGKTWAPAFDVLFQKRKLAAK